MKPPIQNLSLKIYFEHERNENSTLWCSGFPENYSRWPENLAQKIIIYNAPLVLELTIIANLRNLLTNKKYQELENWRFFLLNFRRIWEMSLTLLPIIPNPLCYISSKHSLFLINSKISKSLILDKNKRLVKIAQIGNYCQLKAACCHIINNSCLSR